MQLQVPEKPFPSTRMTYPWLGNMDFAGQRNHVDEDFGQTLVRMG